MISAVRAACGLIACGLLLAGCAGPTTNEKPLVLSPNTNAFFQAYLTSTSSRSAFAVSEDGIASFYSYCGSGTCNGLNNIGNEAIKGCEKLGQGRCVVLGSNGLVKRSYTVAPGEIELPPGMARFISGDQIRRELAGNSIVMSNVDGKIWAEYFAPDGTLRGRSDRGRLFGGTWKIEGTTLCVDYDSVGSDWCGQFTEGADGSISYYEDGHFKKTYPRSVLQEGNPQNL
jgi:hypothetical protein